MTNQLFNLATAGLVAAAIALPSSTALAQRSRGDAPATGGAVARDPVPSPSPAPATASESGGRSDGGSSRSGGDSGDRSGGGRSRAASGGDSGTSNGGRNDGAVTGSRPRGDRNPTGQVVERRPETGGGGDTIIIPGGGYFPWGWGGLGFGGLYGGYYGGFYDGWGYDPYQGGGGGGGGYYSGNAADGSLRIKVKPRDAAVYIDGYFAGTVDDFDGAFQRLHIDGGPHRIEIRADGYQPLTFEVNIQPDRTVTYKGELEKVQ